jgi:hypothetical protein
VRHLALVALLAACGGAEGATVVEVPPQDLPPSPQPVVQEQVVAQAPLMRGGEDWVGVYTCAQGKTDLVLHIDGVSGSSVSAVFEFSHSPSGAGGAYRLLGTIQPDGAVTLVPGAWLDRPSGYISVGMSGRVRGNAFTGRITEESCGSFALTRRLASRGG